jgi:hypothetical protein
MAAGTALGRGDGETAASDLAELDRIGLHAPLIEARRTALLAGLAGLGHDVNGSLRLYEAALGEFRELGLPFDEAWATIVMASILDPSSPEVAQATARARAILVGLRAEAFLDVLDAAASRSATPQATKAAAAT